MTCGVLKMKRERIPAESELEPDTISQSLRNTLTYTPTRIVGRVRDVRRVIRQRLVSSGRAVQKFARDPGGHVRTTLRGLKQQLDLTSSVQMTALLIVFGLFLILPLGSVVVTSFFDSNGRPTLDHFVGLFSDSNFWPWQWRYNNQTQQNELVSYIDLNTVQTGGDLVIIQGWDLGTVLNSIYVALFVTGIAILLGVFFAFIVARYDFPGKSILKTLLILPVLGTPFIGAIGIKKFMGQYGFVNNLFYTQLHWLPFRYEMRGLAAIIFVQSLTLFSLVYLNAYSSFIGIDPTLEEQAENLGATGFKLFRKVTLPLAMPGIQAGAILTFILSIEDLGTPLVYSKDDQARKTLAYHVYSKIFASQTGTIDPSSPAAGLILLVFAFVGFLAIRRYASLRSYAGGTKGGQWNPRTRRLSNMTTLLLYAMIIPLLFVALIPKISVIVLSFAETWSTNAVLPDAWTLDNYSVLWAVGGVSQSVILTMVYSGVATLIIVVLGTSAAYLVSRKDIPGKTLLDLLVTSPIALPGIVIATGYFTLFYNSPIFPQDHPAFLITMSYTVRKFPFTVRAAYAGLQSTPASLEEAAMNVGASRGQTFFRITIPLIGISVLAGALLSFVYSVSEVSTSLILGSVNAQEAPMTFWTNEILGAIGEYGGYFSAACLGVVMMVLQVIVISITNKILGAKSSAMTGI